MIHLLSAALLAAAVAVGAAIPAAAADDQGHVGIAPPRIDKPDTTGQVEETFTVANLSSAPIDLDVRLASVHRKESGSWDFDEPPPGWTASHDSITIPGNERKEITVSGEAPASVALLVSPPGGGEGQIRVQAQLAGLAFLGEEPPPVPDDMPGTEEDRDLPLMPFLAAAALVAVFLAGRLTKGGDKKESRFVGQYTTQETYDA